MTYSKSDDSPSPLTAEHEKSNVQVLAISDINLSLQVRAVDDETVSDYANALRRGDELPPVTIAFDEATHTHFLVDGFHRTESHKRNGKTHITATVVSMPKQEAMWLALGANRCNARRMSNQDKRDAVLLALNEFPEKSSREIAEQVGCTHAMVCTYRLPKCQPLTAEFDEGTIDDRHEVSLERGAEAICVDANECESVIRRRETVTSLSTGTVNNGILQERMVITARFVHVWLSRAKCAALTRVLRGFFAFRCRPALIISFYGLVLCFVLIYVAVA